MLTFGEGKQ